MLQAIRLWITKQRIAACSIAIEQAEIQARNNWMRINRLAQKEIDLRIQYSNMRQPLGAARPLVIYPEVQK